MCLVDAVHTFLSKHFHVTINFRALLVPASPVFKEDKTTSKI